MSFYKAKKLFMWITLLAVLTIGMGIFFLPNIMIYLAEGKLHRLGLPHAQIEKINAGYDGLRITNLTLSEDKKNKIELIDIYFGEQFSIKKILIAETDIEIDVTDYPKQLKIADHVITFDDNNATQNFIPLIPVREIEIKNATVQLVKMDTAAQLRFQGFIYPKQTEQKIEIKGDLDLLQEDTQLATTLTMNMEHDKTELNLTLKDGHIKHDPLSIKRLSGWLTLVHEANMPLSINSEINAGALNLSDILMQSIQLTYQLKNNEHHVLSTWKAPNDQGSFSLDSRLSIDQSLIKISGLFDLAIHDLEAFQATLGAADNKAKGRLASNINFNAVYDKNIPHNVENPFSAITALDAKASINAQDISIKNVAEDLSTKIQFSASQKKSGDVILTINDDFKISHGAIKNRAEIKISADDDTPTLLTYRPNGALQLSLGSLTGRFADHTLSLQDLLIKGKNKDDLTLSAENISLQKGEIKYITPFNLNGSIKKLSQFKSTLSDDKGLFYALLNATYAPQVKELSVSFNLPPMPLIDKVFTLKDLFPISANYLSSLTGQKFGIQSDFVMKDGALQNSHASILLEQMDAMIADQAISGINGVITIESLSPLNIKNQRLGINTIHIGLPLTQGVTEFSVDGAKEKLTIHRSDWVLAEGKLTAEPFDYYFNDTSANTLIKLKADNLNLAKISELANMDGLKASGYVNGSIPILIRPNKTFEIKDAKLSAAQKGSLQYDPLNPPDFLKDQTQTQIVDLKTALKNFEYDVLEMSIDSLPDDKQKIHLKLAGRNPDFYDGYPVNLNLNLEGDLENVIQSSVKTFSLDSAIQKQIEDYQKNHVPQ